MKITHVKIRNYRNLRDIDIGLAETVAIIGEKNKLYVALTRSLNELSIYILKEVEDKYTKKRIQDFFERYL